MQKPDAAHFAHKSPVSAQKGPEVVFIKTRNCTLSTTNENQKLSVSSGAQGKRESRPDGGLFFSVQIADPRELGSAC
jgi:hypothetical protein